jgi:hypothetical protein
MEVLYNDKRHIGYLCDCVYPKKDGDNKADFNVDRGLYIFYFTT